ncbi:glutaredoxin family protein [Ectothiorhodospira lacustris]|uniref:glutaredoxin family protein n=1 Tax=Ectothiorhodospira lacustris TaxID=2899127 RepID=UPI001EE82402|nr:glutaredoxin family protein [Ectothiorhodospira lacustris]MCG5500533.1 glutaredoxin family protein [Ectothiorhodospira lacustris]MCG5509394.1 glutaredoxin family protein [Ectothiorhodospira lacustris]MCG5521448.1 glutaredoxin family protein [Ectothiorhodospira lacustris]
MRPEVILYHREGCHLCERMSLELRSLQDELGFDIREVDIDADTALKQRFNAKIPVLAVGEEILCCHFLDEQGLRLELAGD